MLCSLYHELRGFHTDPRRVYSGASNHSEHWQLRVKGHTHRKALRSNLPGSARLPDASLRANPTVKKNCSLHKSKQQHGLEVSAGIKRIINTWSLYQLEWRHRRSTFAPGMPGIPSRPSTPGKPWSNTSTQQRGGGVIGCYSGASGWTSALISNQWSLTASPFGPGTPVIPLGPWEPWAKKKKTVWGGSVCWVCAPKSRWTRVFFTPLNQVNASIWPFHLQAQAHPSLLADLDPPEITRRLVSS